MIILECWIIIIIANNLIINPINGGIPPSDIIIIIIDIFSLFVIFIVKILLIDIILFLFKILIRG